MYEDCSQNVMNGNMYIAHYQLFKKEWGSLTKRTPKMKLQQAFILEV